jgi:unsaturated rhamnogalacturonyl hydrolase
MRFGIVVALGLCLAGCSHGGGVKTKDPASRIPGADFASWPAGQSPEEIGRRVAARFVASPHPNFGRTTPPARITYPEICAWYGALTFADLTGDTALRAHLVKRFEPLFGEEKALVPVADHVDHSVFGAVPFELFRQTKEPRYLDMGRDIADKQWGEPFGQRAKPESWEYYKKGLTWQTRLWIDDMYMITALQAQAYRAIGDRRYIDRAAKEMVVYLDELQKPNGLFYHAPDVPFYWGRGNGWMAAGTSELLRSLPLDNPDRPRILDGYRKMMAALRKYQGADGMWRQLIDRPESWPETSSTGMFTFAFVTGVHEGWLDAKTYGPAARKAWLGLISYLNEDADVREVCQGTNKKNDYQYYMDRERITGDMHGQAPILWTASALLRATRPTAPAPPPTTIAAAPAPAAPAAETVSPVGKIEAKARAAEAPAATAAPTPAPRLTTDDQFREVLARVAKLNAKPVADGDYAPVTTLEAARAAKTPEGLTWSYPWGVTLYGILRSTDATKDEAVSRFVVEHDQLIGRYYTWLTGVSKTLDIEANPDAKEFVHRTKLRQLMRLGSLDSCGAMATQMLEMMLRHPDKITPEMKVVVERAADWVVNKQARLPEGTLWRPKSPEGPTVWPDDLYMGGVFLTRWYLYTGDRKHIDDAALQVIKMAERMQDKDGLWFHGYFENDKKTGPIKWGRGMGWAVLCTAEVLSVMPEDHPDRAKVLEIFRRSVEGLKKHQAPSGMWRQIVDMPDLWEETSATAMFAYSIARGANRGWLDAADMAVARKAFEALTTQVNADGSVENTCEGTNIRLDVAYYRDRQRPQNDRHGVGVLLLAGTEVLKTPVPEAAKTAAR